MNFIGHVVKYGHECSTSQKKNCRNEGTGTHFPMRTLQIDRDIEILLLATVSALCLYLNGVDSND